MQKKGGVARGSHIGDETAALSRPLQLIVYWPPLVPGLRLSKETVKHASQVLWFTQAIEAADNQGALLPRALYFHISWHRCLSLMRYLFAECACYESSWPDQAWLSLCCLSYILDENQVWPTTQTQ